MPVNKRSKFRGTRTCGGGTHKNRRGAGNRGGRGLAGSHKKKHRFVKFYLNGYTWGKHGFKRKNVQPSSAIDIGMLDQMTADLVECGVAEMDGDIVVIDAGQIGIDKILGSGQVTQKMNITAKAFSEQAKVKIESAGGQTQIA